jgi:hypothetical protein
MIDGLPALLIGRYQRNVDRRVASGDAAIGDGMDS